MRWLRCSTAAPQVKTGAAITKQGTRSPTDKHSELSLHVAGGWKGPIPIPNERERPLCTWGNGSGQFHLYFHIQHLQHLPTGCTEWRGRGSARPLIARERVAERQQALKQQLPHPLDRLSLHLYAQDGKVLGLRWVNGGGCVRVSNLQGSVTLLIANRHTRAYPRQSRPRGIGA
jgi:hypothetical protein